MSQMQSCCSRSGCSAHDPTEDTERRYVTAIGCSRGIVAVPTIRPRILKVRHATTSNVRSVVAVPTIRPRILKVQARLVSWMRHGGCSAHDPTEDTESDCRCRSRCAAGSSCSAHDPTEDTERRCRLIACRDSVGCSAHDPTEDTESGRIVTSDRAVAVVAVPTIRPRILKVQLQVGDAAAGAGCSAHDPTEDTESRHTRLADRAVDQRCSAHDPTEDTESG